MKLYSYWRSTTSYRLRIALNLKQVDHDIIAVNLLKGEQKSAAYRAINPMAGVPSLQLDDGTILTQSMAILDYLDATIKSAPFVNDDPLRAAKIRAASHIIACDIHPVNNLRVGARLKAMGHDQNELENWMRHWMQEGFAAFQTLIEKDNRFCFGDAPSLADICLIPQLYNAHRWRMDLGPFVRLLDIEKNCLALEAFQKAMPEHQSDAPFETPIKKAPTRA
ncbi:MAG: maleylacetoacetate isomerase [Cohaesibacter sp.]|nr:maleylacetoacetate isomerase [Cohaesibacter sp.]MCV6600421.1 maleylacetoacetate isomerase [Cohaesibacter sp.]